MLTVRAIALFMILAFGGCVIAAGVLTGPASAGKMNGKPGGKGLAQYGTPKNPPTKKTGTQ